MIEILHVASLVHDDILDASETRRGIPSSHIIYGKHRATFSANYLIGRAYIMSKLLEEEKLLN